MVDECDNEDDFKEYVEDEEYDENSLFTSAWLLKGITGSVSGYLELRDERLTFTTGEDELYLFNVPLSEVKDVVFPWYYFGGGVKLRIGAHKYRFSFIEPYSESGVLAARVIGKEWKAVLTPGKSS